MENRRITINIAGRTYPLNIKPSEEEMLRRVGKQIENMIKDFENNFDIRDKQDALAMCCLKMGSDAESNNMALQNSSQEVISRLRNLSESFSEFEK